MSAFSACETKSKEFLTGFHFFKFFLWILFGLSGIIFSMGCVSSLYATDLNYDSHGRRDPFIPLVSGRSASTPGELLGVETLDDVRIEGVVFDSKHGSVAIVNGTVVKEGQEFGNVKVIEVKSNGALVVVNGEEAFKSLYKSSGAEARTGE